MEHHRLFESEFTPMASPDCIAMVERKLGRKLEPNDVPDQNLISPADDWWQQWFSDNGVPADEAVLRRRPGSAWRTRRTKAMRRWRGRASRC